MVRRTTLLRRRNGARFGLQGRFADVRRFRRAARRLESHGSPAALKRASRYQFICASALRIGRSGLAEIDANAD